MSSPACVTLTRQGNSISTDTDRIRLHRTDEPDGEPVQKMDIRTRADQTDAKARGTVANGSGYRRDDHKKPWITHISWHWDPPG